MSGNPLMVSPRHDTARNLDAFVEAANRNFWVQDSRRPYFINERPGPDGVMIRFMDRNG